MRAGRLTKLMHHAGDIPPYPTASESSQQKLGSAIDPSIIEYAAEMVLAHRPSKEIVKAYLTEDFFEQRQPMMQRLGGLPERDDGVGHSPTRSGQEHQAPQALRQKWRG